MKFAIFGTGKYYQGYKQYINQEDLLFFIDNNEKKWGQEIDGKEIISPAVADYDKCDFVIVMILQYEEVFAQLVTLGVPIEKIKSYHSISKMYDMTTEVVSANGNTNIQQWKERHVGEKCIFVCSHEFSRSGVPIVLMHVCVMLKKMGYTVLFSALLGGTLEQELRENEIDYITDLGLFYKNKDFLNVLEDFDMIFLGSLGTSDFGMAIASFSTPIVWWLHESEDILYKRHKLVIKDNIFYYGVGKRVVEKFQKYYKKGYIKEMPYFLPDNNCVSKVKNDKIIFAMIGTINKRKAQDIFVKAIEQMGIDIVNRARYIIVGAYNATDSLLDLPLALKNNSHLEWIDEMSQEEVKQFYKYVDVLVCPSRDDPLPIVVSQALQNGIPCIVSNEVGQSEFLVDGKGGMVVPAEDANALAIAMTKYIKDEGWIKESSKGAREIFESHFSEQVMRKNLEEIVCELIEM